MAQKTVLPTQSARLAPYSLEPQFPCLPRNRSTFLCRNGTRSMCSYHRVLVYPVGGGDPVSKLPSLRAYHQFHAKSATKATELPRVHRKPSPVCFSFIKDPASSPRSVKAKARLGGDGDVDIYGDVIAEDYYSVLGLTPDSTPDEIKKAYYSCMKTCHPDLSGNSTAVNDFCMFINEVYEVLSDPEQRMIYDEINGYTLTAINPFRDRCAEKTYAFVDEFTCIGCKNCAHTAPATFDIEENYGRARVISQDGNLARVDMAIQTCPVDCIHWVTAPQLTLLEDEMRIIERVNVGMMLSGMGSRAPDVFTEASWKWDKRQARAVERARVRMVKESGKTGKEAWWNVQWGSAADEKSSKVAADKYARERTAKTAAAARRWREYSRQGVDRRAIRNLPSALWAEGEEEAEKEKAEAK